MCGIWSIVSLNRKNIINYVKLFENFYNLKSRGPDNSYFETYNNVILGFHRLAIMNDNFSSNQPFILEDDLRTVILLCNGEIYNFKNIINKYNLPQNGNDCITIAQMYFKMTANGSDDDFIEFVSDEVKGEFAFTLFEFDRFKNLRKVLVMRDQIGIRPLYYHPYSTDSKYLFFSSELKGGIDFPGSIQEFPPGHAFIYNINELGEVTTKKKNLTYYLNTAVIPFREDDFYLKNIQTAVLNSIRRRLCADKPFAFLLSGGVDSSLVAGLSAKILGKPIQTFCCSLMGEDGKGVGTDLQYAKMVADHIGSNHTEVLFTPEEGLAAIPDVIRTIESWDTTTVRASCIQYLVCKYIGQHTDCKVVMVGETADEVCSSYLFNWNALNGEALHNCAKEYVQKIHYFDVKRADRCIARWGLEGRVPFSDSEFFEAYWAIPGEQRMPTYKNMEKWWLRKAFDGTDVLPNEVLFRTKEAQSDGCSSKKKSWFQIIQEFVEDKVTDEELATAQQKYPFCTPTTKEAYYYRRIFCEIFGEHRQDIVPHYWQPKWDSNGKEITEYIDPSARVLNVYNSLN